MKVATVSGTRYELLLTVEVKGKQTQQVIHRNSKAAGEQTLEAANEVLDGKLRNVPWTASVCGVYGTLTGVVGLFKVTTKVERVK